MDISQKKHITCSEWTLPHQIKLAFTVLSNTSFTDVQLDYKLIGHHLKFINLPSITVDTTSTTLLKNGTGKDNSFGKPVAISLPLPKDLIPFSPIFGLSFNCGSFTLLDIKENKIYEGKIVIAKDGSDYHIIYYCFDSLNLPPGKYEIGCTSIKYF